jgi:hypothetical protein
VNSIVRTGDAGDEWRTRERAAMGHRTIATGAEHAGGPRSRRGLASVARLAHEQWNMP